MKSGELPLRDKELATVNSLFSIVRALKLRDKTIIRTNVRIDVNSPVTLRGGMKKVRIIGGRFLQYVWFHFRVLCAAFTNCRLPVS